MWSSKQPRIRQTAWYILASSVFLGEPLTHRPSRYRRRLLSSWHGFNCHPRTARYPVLTYKNPKSAVSWLRPLPSIFGIWIPPTVSSVAQFSMPLNHGVESRIMNVIKIPASDPRLKLSPEHLLCNTNRSVRGGIMGMSERLSENDCLLFRGALAELFGI